jgi:hypothetical protein
MPIHITVSASSGMIHAPTFRHRQRPDHAYTCPSAVLKPKSRSRGVWVPHYGKMVVTLREIRLGGYLLGRSDRVTVSDFPYGRAI